MREQTFKKDFVVGETSRKDMNAHFLFKKNDHSSACVLIRTCKETARKVMVNNTGKGKEVAKY